MEIFFLFIACLNLTVVTIYSSDVYKDYQTVTRKLCCCLDFGCNASGQSIMKYKLFSKCSIKQVRSPHWHWSSGLDTLGSFLARWIKGCLYFTTGVCCFFPLLNVIFPCHCHANFPSEFTGSAPINTCHSYFISPENWHIGVKMEGNLRAVAKERCARIITEKTPGLISTCFHLEASAQVLLDKLRGQIWSAQYAVGQKKKKSESCPNNE